MSFGGGSGGSSSIHTSSDVILNNPATSDVLTYDAGLGKWKNATLDDKVTALGTVRIWPADTVFPTSGMQEGDLFPYIGS